MRQQLTQRFITSIAIFVTLLCVEASDSQETVGDLRDGPYVIWQSRNTAQVLSFCNGAAQSELYSVEVARHLPDPCDPAATVFVDPTPPVAPPSTWPMPDRLLAISDIEGNVVAMMSFLQANSVVDTAGHWSFGTGHLLFNGDIVDRGDAVTETLNAIRRLQREASAAGGRVHFVLGNHEAMILAGDVRYVHPKYTAITEALGMPYESLYGANTELGRWLRTRNSIVRIGDWMFVHGGYSPSLDALGMAPDEINVKIRSTLGTPAWPKNRTIQDHPAWHMDGPLWYRGYHPRHAEEFGGTNESQLRSLLQRNTVKHVVVGHTLVDDVTWLNHDRLVLCIDVDWAKAGEAEGVLIEGDKAWRVNGSGDRHPIDQMSAAQSPRVLDDDGAWCWFQDERCIVHDGVLYVGSVSSGHNDPDRRGDVNVLMHHLDTGTTQRIELHDKLQVDDHDDPALLATSDGVLALWATHGGDWTIYRRTIKPDGSLTPMVSLSITKADGYGVTYANLFRHPDGTLTHLYRGAGWDPNILRSSDGGITWTEEGRMLGGPGRPYLRYADDSKGRIHFFATEQHPRNFDNSVYHGMLDGNAVRDSRGVVRGIVGKTPPSPEEMSLVFAGNADNVAWCAVIEIDADDHPVVGYSVQKDSAGMKVGTGGTDLRYRYARFDGSTWHDHPLAHAGTRLFAREDDYAGLIAIDPANVNTVFFSTDAHPMSGEPLVSVADDMRHHEIWRGDTDDRGATWSFTPVTADSTADNLRPMMPEGADEPILVWLRGNYRTYTDFDQAVVCLVGDEIPVRGSTIKP